MTDLRDVVLARVKSELFGPAGAEDETIVGRPYWRYLCGMLFPVELSSEGLEEDDEKDAQAVSTGDEQADPAVALAYDALPSSMGVSFFVTAASRLACRVEGARYQPHADTEERWVRNPLGTSKDPTYVELKIPPGDRGRAEEPIWGGARPD